MIKRAGREDADALAALAVQLWPEHEPRELARENDAMTMELTALLEGFAEASKSILGEDLTGVYLHGSAAMGCFNPAKSDVDLITVAEKPLTEPVKRAYLDMTAAYSARGPAKGIEMSVVLRSVCAPFVYPTPYELHFSLGHLARYRADPDAYIREMQGTDRDLAAHFTIIKKRGRCLWGAPIEAVFGEVPGSDYLDALLYDVEGAAEEITARPLYLTLNLARVLAYREEGLVLSKKEGGEWAAERLPAEFRPLLRAALEEYAGSGEAVYEEALTRRCAEYMLKRLRP